MQGNTVHLLKPDEQATVTGKFRVGAAWDTSTRGQSGFIGRLSRKVGADLDLVAVMFEDGEPVRMAGLDNNDPLKNGSVVHSGDNQSGRGEGDDETIDVDLDKIDDEVDKIVFMVAAFKEVNRKMGDTGFQGAENVEFTVYDNEVRPPQKQFRIRPSLMGRENCCIVAVLKRESIGWVMTKANTKVHVEHGNRDKLLMAAVNA